MGCNRGVSITLVLDRVFCPLFDVKVKLQQRKIFGCTGSGLGSYLA